MRLALKLLVPLMLAVTIGAELSFDSPINGPSSGTQGFASVCAGTNGKFLVAWLDARKSSSPLSIFAARVDSTGAVLDPAGIELGLFNAGFNNQIQPEIAFDGTNWLVTWASSAGGVYGIRAARVTQAGVVLDPGGFLVSNRGGYQPFLAFDGTNYLVAWTDSRNSPTSKYDIYASRVTPAGVVLDPNGINLTPNPAWRDEASLAFDGTNYLLVYGETPNSGGTIRTYGRFITPAGTLVGTAAFPVSTRTNGQYNGYVSFDGTNYLVSWSEGSDIWATRISPAGALLDTGFLVLSKPGNQYAYDQRFDGTNHWLSITDYGTTSPSRGTPLYVRISAAGTVLDPSGTLIFDWPTANVLAPAIAVTPTGDFAAVTSPWNQGGNAHIFGTRISNTGTITDPNGILISKGTNGEFNPASSFGSGSYLTVWEDDRNSTDSGTDLYAARMSGSGTVLDSPAIALSTAPSYQIAPAVAFDGTQWWTIWEDARSTTYGEIYGARVSKSGVNSDPNGLPIATKPTDGGTWSYVSSQQVACSGSTCLVSFYMGGSPYTLRLGPSGPLDPAPRAHDYMGANLSLAATDAGFFLVGQNGAALGLPMDRSGNVTTADGGAQVLASSNYGIQGPRAGSDGTNFWAFWSQRPPDAGTAPSSTYDVYATRVSPTGALIDSPPIRVTYAGKVQGTLSTGYSPDAPYAIVSWIDQRGFSDGGSALYAARLAADGTVIDPNGFLVANGIDSTQVPRVAPVGDSKQLFTYQRFDTSSQRAKAVRLNLLPLGAACGSSDVCGSNFCVDGVCCNSACGGGATNDCQACSAAAGAAQNGTCGGLTGSACTDGDSCTQTDVCQAGTCVGSNPVVCTSTNACKQPGVCNPANGVCSVGSNVPNGTTCDDGLLCSTASACQAGSCVATVNVTCAPIDECHVAGSCQPNDGQCSTGAAKADGTACSIGTCRSGVCTAPPDAGVPDAGAPDSGVIDAGVDAGEGSGGGAGGGEGGGAGGGSGGGGGSIEEPGVDAGTGGVQKSGCGCGATGADLGLWVGLAGVAMMIRRRKLFAVQSRD